MKTKFILLCFSLCLLLSHTNLKGENSPIDQDSEKDKVLISVLNYMLTRGHYVQKDLNDEFSKHVFTNFIDGLDPSK
jgi:carboxyl-terminal processing protease